jgi:hypothetical protein
VDQLHLPIVGFHHTGAMLNPITAIEVPTFVEELAIRAMNMPAHDPIAAISIRELNHRSFECMNVCASSLNFQFPIRAPMPSSGSWWDPDALQNIP